MNTFSPGQMAVASGRVQVFDHIENEGPMWSGQGERWAHCVVVFEQPFAKPPIVQLSIAMIDADSDKNLRLELGTEDVQASGFKAVVHTWSDSRIGRLQLNWTAIGESPANAEALWDV